MTEEEIQANIASLKNEILELEAQIKQLKLESDKALSQEIELLQRRNACLSNIIDLRLQGLKGFQSKLESSIAHAESHRSREVALEAEQPHQQAKASEPPVAPNAEVLPSEKPAPAAAPPKPVVHRYSAECKKIKRDNKEIKRSIFTLHSEDGKPDIQFEMEHKSKKGYPSGAFSLKVKKGFLPGEDKPRYAIKVFNPKVTSSPDAQKRDAMHGAYCARLLGRTGQTFFRNKKQYFITDWHDQWILADQATKAELLKMPIPHRVGLAMSLVEQVAMLHSEGIIYRDMKPQNVMVSKQEIKLFDLDSIWLRSDKTETKPMCTTPYLDKQLNLAVINGTYLSCMDEKSDLYALGLTLACLFPELFSTVEHHVKFRQAAPVKYAQSRGIFPLIQSQAPTRSFMQFKLKSESLSLQHPELVKVLLDLTNEDKTARIPSATEAFERLAKINALQYKQPQQSINLSKGPEVQSAVDAFKEIDQQIKSQKTRR